ncbi:hypothetical protein GRS96_06370 [Rathayibacter sp. VKM Ac-2803]|nr:hypothetical protein [Rathayibacter sp. VKM Ac-2803]
MSLGLAILGRPGADRGEGRRGERLQELTKSAELLIERIDRMDPNELGDFLRTDVLQELLDKRVGQVGRYERGIFADAFKVLIEENFDVVNLEQCWRAS